jgi:hypothetical protein
LAYLSAASPGCANAILSGPDLWDGRIAIRLMHDADALVGRLGVDGRHPRVQGTAAVVSASATRDMETLRFAVAEFAALFRALASERMCADE